MNLLRYFFLKTQTAFVPFGFPGLSQRTESVATTSIQKQSGFTVALSTPVTDAVMAAKAVYDGSKDIGKSKNDRVNAMAVANTAWGAYQAGTDLGSATGMTGSGSGSGGSGISVSITYGKSEAKQVSHDQAAISVGSTVNAGGNVNITATGAGEKSNINIVGSDVYGGTGSALKANNQINIVSAEDVISNRSKNDSYSANAGVALAFDNGVSLGITAGGSYGKGKSNSDTVNQHNSHVGSGGLTTLESGGTTTIAGGQVTGKRVEVDAQDLIIQSKQDTNKANSQQFDASLQVTVGYGVSVSGSVSASKAKADYASVNEQSGIIAGDGGYNVNVKNNINLIGGIVTSSQAAEDAGKNSLSTGTLTSTDVQNHADYSATGFGIGGGFAMNGTGANTNQMTPQNTSSTEQGKASLTANKSVGFGMDSGHDNSTTASGINTSNITITNAAGQAATGKSVEQIKAEVATGTTTDTVALNSGHIANNYDAQAVQDEINLQVRVSQQFDKTRQGIKAEFNQAIDDLKQEQKDPKTTPERSAEIDESLKKWQTGGVLLDIVAGGLAAPTNAVGGIVAGALAPAVSYQIGQHFKENGTEGSFNHILAHTILGAAVAAAGGNNALIGGLSAGGAEAAAPAVMHYLYGKDIQVKDLTAEQKTTISAIVGLGGAAIGATGGAGDVTQGSMAAVNAVEENQQINLGQWTNGLAMGMPPIVNACAGLVPGACDAYSKELQEKAAKKITLLDVAEFALEACSVAPTPAAGACRTASLVKDVGTVAYDVYTLATVEDATFKEKSKNAQKIIIVDVFGKVLERTLERKSAAFRSLPNKYKESVIEAAKLGVDKTVSKMLGV